MYFDKLDVVNKYNSTYHRTIKMEPVDVLNNAFIIFGRESIDKDPKFKVVIM